MNDMSEKTQQALIRVRDKAKVKAPDSAILSWINSVGAETILASTLTEIRDVAGAF